jgi:hypothetical protein
MVIDLVALEFPLKQLISLKKTQTHTQFLSLVSALGPKIPHQFSQLTHRKNLGQSVKQESHSSRGNCILSQY